MPRSCCIPNCKSNYYSNEGYVPLFTFPSDENKLALWKKKIPRKDYNVTKNMGVCIKHFEKKFIVKTTCKSSKDGKCFYKFACLLSYTNNVYK